MSSTLFKQFIKRAVLSKQPGGPPRPGLQWKPSTHRWIRPKEIINPYSDHIDDQSLREDIFDYKEEYLPPQIDPKDPEWDWKEFPVHRLFPYQPEDAKNITDLLNTRQRDLLKIRLMHNEWHRQGRSGSSTEKTKELVIKLAEDLVAVHLNLTDVKDDYTKKAGSLRAQIIQWIDSKPEQLDNDIFDEAGNYSDKTNSWKGKDVGLMSRGSGKNTSKESNRDYKKRLQDYKGNLERRSQIASRIWNTDYENNQILYHSGGRGRHV